MEHGVCLFVCNNRWVPAYLRSAGHVKTTTSLWAVLLAMVAFAIGAPLAGWLSDKGVRKVSTY